MNFSLLTDIELFDAFYKPFSDTIEADQIELPDDWKDFENLLGRMKNEYVSLKNEMVKNMAELREKTNDNILIKKISKIIERNEHLKEKVDEIINSPEFIQETQILKKKVSALKGKCQAMEKVLVDTNAGEYAKFQCFVCMERYVDLFLDPCGHVICSHCWMNANSETCPGCRTRIQMPRKIFTLN